MRITASSYDAVHRASLHQSPCRRARLFADLVRFQAAGGRFAMPDGEAVPPLGTRAADNCFEHGEGARVDAALVALIVADRQLAAAVLASHRFHAPARLDLARRVVAGDVGQLVLL
ncbi:MAG: hypothetical protein MUE77_06425 [Sandarakinorhabdus sp.]|jgi:hypothetical protein|nr:hypothetical protein [Sandarakinorhabdus sp.]